MYFFLLPLCYFGYCICINSHVLFFCKKKLINNIGTRTANYFFLFNNMRVNDAFAYANILKLRLLLTKGVFLV